MEGATQGRKASQTGHTLRLRFRWTPVGELCEGPAQRVAWYASRIPYQFHQYREPAA